MGSGSDRRRWLTGECPQRTTSHAQRYSPKILKRCFALLGSAGTQRNTAIFPTWAAAPAIGSLYRPTTGTTRNTTLERFTGENASCWPDASEHPPSYVPQPYPAKRLLGGAICSWSNPQIVEELMFFGDCFKDRMPLGYSGPGWPRPAPRAPIVAERMWAGATATSQDVLERVGCAYWEIPPPPPPSPPPAPGGAFAPMPGS